MIMLYKLTYVILWSIGLFVATFGFNIHSGALDLDISEETKFIDILKSYILPLILAMALFLVDALYSYELDKESKKKTQLDVILFLVILFLILFGLSMIANEVINWAIFILAWIVLTIMKGLSTTPFQPIKKPRGVGASDN